MLCIAILLRLPTKSPEADQFPLSEHSAETSHSSASTSLLSELMQANHTTFFSPTPPPHQPTLSLPWDTSRYVLVQLSLQNLLAEPGLFQVYHQFLSAALPHIEVMALFHRSEYKQIPAFLQAMQDKMQDPSLLDRLVWVPSDTQSIWVRDYGPQFAHNRSNQLVVYDNSFRDPRTEISNLLSLEASRIAEGQHPLSSTFYSEIERLRGDDMAPSVVATFLNLYHEDPVLLVRPPLALLGGDFIPIHAKEVIVSQSTLESNGGRADLLVRLMRRYYGVDKVHFLSHLPGNTINHLDFILAPMDDNTILIATPPPAPAANRIYQRLLHREITQVLEKNRLYLQKHFPRHKLIEVPLPPLAVDTDANIMERLTITLVQTVASQMGLSPDEAFQYDSTRPDVRRLHPDLWQKIRDDTGIDSLSNLQQLSLACQHYFGQSSEEILNLYVENFAVYRSYLNALLVVNPDGHELVFIPRYQPRNGEEQSLIPELEKQVLAAYREARPHASLHWIDCDPLIDDLGAVHCFASTIPQIRKP